MPSQHHALFNLTLVLTEPVRRNTFVDLSGATATPGDYAYGVATVNGKADEAIAVEVLGTSQVLAGGPLEVGDPVEVGPGGTAVKSVGAGVMVGRAVQATRSGRDDELVEVYLIQS